MAFDIGVSSTWGEFWGDLYTKLNSLQGYDVVDESVDGTGDSTLGADKEFSGTGQWWVLSLPTGEFCRFVAGNLDLVHVEYGPDWDTQNESWIDRYPADPVGLSFPDLRPQDDNYGFSFTEDVEYNLKYDQDQGFVFDVVGQSGSDRNSACRFGMAELASIWNYTIGDEAGFSYCYFVPPGGISVHNQLAGGVGGRDRTVTARARVNGKTDFANVPLARPNVVASGKWAGTLVGTHNLWLDPYAGFANGDVIENNAGNPIYRVFIDERRHAIDNLAIQIF